MIKDERGWLAPTYERLTRDWAQLPHALLLSGPEGIGKADLALDLARLFLCDNPSGPDPCSACTGCSLIEGSIHPDLHILSAEANESLLSVALQKHAERYWLDRKGASAKKPSDQITVDSVRSLNESLSSTAKIARSKVAIIQNADNLNRNAANALLKLLEEPTPNTYLILTSATTHRLPVTVRSRCARINCDAPDAAALRIWLEGRHALDEIALEGLSQSGLGPLRLDRLVEKGQDQNLLALWHNLKKNLGRFDLAAMMGYCDQLGPELVLAVLQRFVEREFRARVVAGCRSDPGGERWTRAELIRAYYLLGDARERLGSALDTQLCLESTFSQLETRRRQAERV